MMVHLCLELRSIQASPFELGVGSEYNLAHFVYCRESYLSSFCLANSFNFIIFRPTFFKIKMTCVICKASEFHLWLWWLELRFIMIFANDSALCKNHHYVKHFQMNVIVCCRLSPLDSLHYCHFVQGNIRRGGLSICEAGFLDFIHTVLQVSEDK